MGVEESEIDYRQLSGIKEPLYSEQKGIYARHVKFLSFNNNT